MWREYMLELNKIKIPKDKIQHFLVCLGLTLGSYLFTHCGWTSAISVFICFTLVKEGLLDWALEKGCPDWYDVLSNFVGCVVGLILIERGICMDKIIAILGSTVGIFALVRFALAFSSDKRIILALTKIIEGGIEIETIADEKGKGIIPDDLQNLINKANDKLKKKSAELLTEEDRIRLHNEFLVKENLSKKELNNNGYVYRKEDKK